uniref:Uncharacterized protein n=1 Tax=Onchocerca volvulus TaxID=6282 RepID=A0A8R1TUK8_ONCVO
MSLRSHKKPKQQLRFSCNYNSKKYKLLQVRCYFLALRSIFSPRKFICCIPNSISQLSSSTV